MQILPLPSILHHFFRFLQSSTYFYNFIQSPTTSFDHANVYELYYLS